MNHFAGLSKAIEETGGRLISSPIRDPTILFGLWAAAGFPGDVVRQEHRLVCHPLSGCSLLC